MRTIELLVAAMALVTMCKMLYHFWFVVTGVREEAKVKAGLLGPFALLVPSLFEDKAQYHLSRLGPWLVATIVSYMLLFGVAEYSSGK